MNMLNKKPQALALPTKRDGLPEASEALSDDDLYQLVVRTNKPAVSDWIKLGIGVAVAFFAVFIVWSIMAPLSTGAVVSGQVTVAGKRDTIEHLEGGIVQDIYVHPGTRVAKNEPLIRLDPSAIESLKKDSLTKLYALTVRQRRLEAEWNNENTPDFNNLGDEKLSPTARREIKLLEQSQFNERRALYERQIHLFETSKQSDEDILKKLKVIKNNVTEQLRLIDEEIVGIDSLLAKGFASKPRALSLKRQREELKSNMVRLESDIVNQSKKLEENDLEGTKFQTLTRQEVAQNLQQTHVEIETQKSILTRIDDQLARTIVRAPDSGVVMDMQVNTIGEVIAPGGIILDLVPDASNLVISARLNASDGANITPGLDARVRVTAFKGRGAPILEGKVASVSPDVLTDDRTGEAYYQIEISLTSEALLQLEDDQTLQPGFPVEAVIETDHQPVIAYLLAPILNTVQKAFVER